jgi:Fe-S-cluster-containing dehydrogenase component
VASGRGFRAEDLRRAQAPWFASGAQVRRTGEHWPLATTQMHQTMEGRNLIREASIGDYQANPAIFEYPVPDLTLFPDWEYPTYRWGMSIDLSTCIGCGTCTIACQAENNIPVVGKEEVRRGREMHWIRVDRYFAGAPDDPEIRHQPVPCMHCERAPCELVCPVQATVHSDEGLNDQVYNRCIGTRYCSHNCPYKVRRFNFYDYRRPEDTYLNPRRNPEVTIRTRGVMEKCTYCVQRINLARIEAKREDRRIAEGEVMTACQQACPADAIVFGDLNDPDARVTAWREDARSYGLLEELNTRPRTTYLGKLTNPAPDRGPR